MCPAPVGPLPQFHTVALRNTALSSEVCLPSGQSLQVWSREEEDLAGGVPRAQAERKAVGGLGQRDGHKHPDGQRRCLMLRRGREEAAGMRVRCASRVSVEGSVRA